MTSTPSHLQPGIGLRPGGERPELEELVVALYVALYESIAAHSRLGLNVVVDVGHHDAYSQPRGILRTCANTLLGLPVLFVGVRCSLEVVWQRREQSWGQRRDAVDRELRDAVEHWQHDVHAHGLYDLEVDTSQLSATRCAQLIGERLASGPPGSAFEHIAKG